MKPGPKPKPTAQRIAEGNASKRPLPENEPEVEPALLDPPEHMSDLARTEWDRVAPVLFNARIVTELDRSTLAGYCESWGNYVNASVQLQQYGAVLFSKEKNAAYRSPYLDVMNSALKQMHVFSCELGMGPASRSRVSTVEGPDKGSDKQQYFAPKLHKTGA